jgi:type IV pilus assembly protein PilW
MTKSSPCVVKQSGLSLVELMVAITVGLLIVTVIVSVFFKSSQSYAELQKAAQQIENGRYAMDLISKDLHHAGYYGDYANLPPVPAALPDPCVVTAAALTTAPYNYLGLHMQGYNDPAASPIPTCLTNANFVSGTDILVIRRADTEITTAPTLNDVYVQANYDSAAVYFGQPTGFALGSLTGGNAVATVGTSPGSVNPSNAVINPATVLKKANVAGASPVVTGLRLAADSRKYHVHIYFVAPCSRPNGGGVNCTGAADDGGSPIPTLKRLELASVGGAATMNLVPLVEGIENMQIEYGIDSNPAAVNPTTGIVGDGMPDTYVDAPANPVEWFNVVTARVYLLARNTQGSAGHAESKTYTLGVLPGAVAVTPNDNVKRHLYAAEVRLTNPSSRREIP